MENSLINVEGAICKRRWLLHQRLLEPEEYGKYPEPDGNKPRTNAGVGSSLS